MSLVIGEAIVLADKAHPHGACRFAEASQRGKLKILVKSTVPINTLDASLKPVLQAPPTNHVQCCLKHPESPIDRDNSPSSRGMDLTTLCKMKQHH